MFRAFSSPLVLAIGILFVGATVASIAATPAAAGLGGEDDCGSAFDLDGPARLFMPASENATMTGRADLSAETNVSVIVRFPTEGVGTVVRNDSVNVGESGRWTATVNLSGVEEGRTFVAWVQHDGAVVDAIDGEIGTPTATVTVRNQTTTVPEPTVIVQQVHLANGGFVALHEHSPSGRVIGRSSYLQPGTHRNVTVPIQAAVTGRVRLVAMAHKDTDCNTRWGWPIGKDSPYVENGTAVTDAATVYIPTSTPTPTPSPQPTSTTTSQPSPTDTASPTTPPTSTLTTGPGFGIRAALAGVVGTAVLLWRAY